MENKIKLKIQNGYIYYLIDDSFLGMLVVAKGELSDFRAIIRKNRLEINNENIYETLRVCLFELLNHYLYEKEFVSRENLQDEKDKIVSNNISTIVDAAKLIVTKGKTNVW